MKTKLPFEEIEDIILIKKESLTDNNFGKHPELRTTEELLDSGIICLNKHSGPTSHQVIDYLKQILKIKKAGHGGTLDPNVTGVLPVALGNATRVMQTLLPAGKEYVCLMYIHKELPEEKIRQILNSFVGKITQLPPIRSAVKRQERQRKIYYLEILGIKQKDVLFKVGCEAGTYIRRICDDFGKIAGTGAHMKQLIRTKAGPFQQKDWASLHDIADAYYLYKEENNDKELRKIIKPMEFSVQHLQKIWVVDSAVDTLCHGANLSIPGISKINKIEKGDLVAIYTLKNELICLGNAKISAEEIMEKEKGTAVITTKVFMDRGIYPSFKKPNGFL